MMSAAGDKPAVNLPILACSERSSMSARPAAGKESRSGISALVGGRRRRTLGAAAGFANAVMVRVSDSGRIAGAGASKLSSNIGKWPLKSLRDKSTKQDFHHHRLDGYQSLWTASTRITCRRAELSN